MKIQVNGIVRDMTTEEEAEWLEWHENTPNPDITTFSPLSRISSVRLNSVSTTFFTSPLDTDDEAAIALINWDLFIILRC